MASEVILMCSLLFHSSNLLGRRYLQKRICAVVIFCSKKIVVTVLAVFLSFGLDYQTLFEFSQI